MNIEKLTSYTGVTLEWLKNYDIIVHPRCKHTIDELTLYCYKTDKDTGKVLPILEDKKNHVIDSLRYANEGHRRAAVTGSVAVEFCIRRARSNR